MQFTAHGPYVVRRGPFGDTIAMECPTPERAAREAVRMENERQTLARLPVRTATHYGQRRAVRQFINEDIHG